jgi:hypothetical protein
MALPDITHALTLVSGRDKSADGYLPTIICFSSAVTVHKIAYLKVQLESCSLYFFLNLDIKTGL